MSESSLEGRAAGDHRVRGLIFILIALFLVRWWLSTLPGYPSDTSTYKRWALTAAQHGVHTIYDNPQTTYDYPPLYAYLLAPVGKIYELLSPSAARSFADSKTLSILVKLPPQIFDLLVAWLLAVLAFRFGVWRGRNTWTGWLPALLYLFHPAVLLDSAYWGQPDAIHIFLIMAALTLILSGKPEFGWVSAGLACMMKPLALPFLPLLALATLACSGWRRLVTGGLAGIGSVLFVLLPFLITGRGGLVIRRLVTDVTLMPFSSINAHNLWWLLDPWGDARRAVLGPLSPIAIGQILFGLAYLATLARIYMIERRQSGRLPIARGPRPLSAQLHWYAAGAAVVYSFFVFSTVMHENHLIGVLPFLILLIPIERRWKWLFVFVGLTSFINMALHDVYLSRAIFARIGGPSRLYIADFGRSLSQFEYWASVVNAVAILILYAGFMTLGWRLGGRSTS